MTSSPMQAGAPTGSVTRSPFSSDSARWPLRQTSTGVNSTSPAHTRFVALMALA
jgi:hypothetical protein